MEHQHQHNNGVKALLKRYLQGTATPEEAEKIAYWYSTLQNPEQSALSPEEKAILKQSILHNIIRQTAPAKQGVSRKWFRYAAAVLLTACVGGWLYSRYSPAAAPTVVYSGIGITRRVVLPDSSIVIMNAGSTLRIAASFGKRERNIELEGEAFFDIKPNPTCPFRVRHGQLTTTVLGTSFNIRTYPGEENAKVAVASGKVQVDIHGKEGQHFLLESHEMLQYSSLQGNVRKGREDTSSIGQWQRKILDFNGYTLTAMVAELQRQYPVGIQLHTTPADTAHYNISFQQENIQDILAVLTGLTGITYKNENGQIIIYSKTYAP
ncbi:FecR family protein [Chitinophaga sp. HK235]|uniref:FecR family protein n=1 Tax=Chitinophaga sp. HK235 TaxID=2952571 RepID=UPI001BA64E36|nr:FecR family protein [Chitinophaga sp. HK235]